MRRTCVTSVLILVLVASSFGCVAGLDGPAASPCVDSVARRDRSQKMPGAALVHRQACQHVLKRGTSGCSLRSLMQFHFLAFHPRETSAPRDVADGISVRPESGIITSSIGPPETDRGPPHS